MGSSKSSLPGLSVIWPIKWADKAALPARIAGVKFGILRKSKWAEFLRLRARLRELLRDADVAGLKVGIAPA